MRRVRQLKNHNAEAELFRRRALVGFVCVLLALAGLAAWYFRLQVLRHAAIGVTMGPLDVRLHGERATVKFSVMATGGSGGLLPDSARPWAVESDWRDGAGGWQVFRAEWEPML